MNFSGFSGQIISKHYSDYLAYLKDLIGIPSVFTDTAGIERAMGYCKKVLEKSLPDWQVYYDAQHNLIARPKSINTDRPIVYLSAHIDTVDADAGEWAEGHSPFDSYDDEQEIWGRGASDCKAGVAYELFLALLHARGHIALNNVILTITFNEEGSGDKTGAEIGRCLGASLPVSDSATYFIVLENNVRPLTPPVLSIYDRERGNYVIKTSGLLKDFQAWIRAHAQWNPVCIYPDLGIEPGDWTYLQQESRHVCSVPRQENLLYKSILDATPDTVLKAGQERSFGVLPASVARATAASPDPHTLILSNRSFDCLEEVQGQLQGLSYEEMKPFAISKGLDVRQQLCRSPLKGILEDCRSDALDIELTHNIGCSDASIVYNSVAPTFRKAILPLVMGPGTRSQPQAAPPRFTHGRNETFDKRSGLQAMIYITDVLRRLQAIDVP